MTSLDEFLEKIDQQVPFGPESKKGSVLWNIRWYRRRVPIRRILFRGTGMVILVISVTLPIVIDHPPHYENWVPTRLYPIVTQELWYHVLAPKFLAYVLALLTAVNAFYQWQQAWQGYLMAQLQLQGIWGEWEEERAKASTAPTEAERLSIASGAAQKLITDANQIIYAETGGFFKNIKPPPPPPGA